jgi:hypothetical protein
MEDIEPEKFPRCNNEIWIIHENSLKAVYPSHIEKYVNDFGDEFVYYICGFDEEPIEEYSISSQGTHVQIPVAITLTSDSHIIKELGFT